MGRCAILFATLVLGAVAAAAPSASGDARQRRVATEPTVSVFAIDPGDSRTVYAGTNRGVFKSIDGGASWSAGDRAAPVGAVNSLVVDPEQPAVLYAATANGVLKSTDAARTWATTGLKASALALTHPNVSNTVFAGVDGHVFRTTDGGASWEAVLTDPYERFFALAAAANRGATVYAGGGTGVFKTSDGGARWQETSRGLLDGVTADELKHQLVEGFVYALTVAPRRPQTVFLGSDRGVFKTTNGGVSWHAINSGLIRAGGKYAIIGSLAVDPRRTKIVYAAVIWSRSGRGLFKSTNGGRTWRLLRLGSRGSATAVAVDPRDPRTLYAATSSDGVGHAFKSTDAGRTWRALSLAGS